MNRDEQIKSINEKLDGDCDFLDERLFKGWTDDAKMHFFRWLATYTPKETRQEELNKLDDEKLSDLNTLLEMAFAAKESIQKYGKPIDYPYIEGKTLDVNYMRIRWKTVFINNTLHYLESIDIDGRFIESFGIDGKTPKFFEDFTPDSWLRTPSDEDVKFEQHLNTTLDLLGRTVQKHFSEITSRFFKDRYEMAHNKAIESMTKEEMMEKEKNSSTVH